MKYCLQDESTTRDTSHQCIELPINFTIDCDVVNELRDAVVEGEVAADDLRQGQVHRAVVSDCRLESIPPISVIQLL